MNRDAPAGHPFYRIILENFGRPPVCLNVIPQPGGFHTIPVDDIWFDLNTIPKAANDAQEASPP